MGKLIALTFLIAILLLMSPLILFAATPVYFLYVVSTGNKVRQQKKKPVKPTGDVEQRMEISNWYEQWKKDNAKKNAN